MNASTSLEPWRALRHPLWWIALVVLVANDHLLKGAGLLPVAVTGKLSDVAGLVVAPALLATLLGARRTAVLVGCHVAPVLALAALKLVPGAADAVVAMAARLGETWAIVADPTDVLAAPAAALAWRVLVPAMRAPLGARRPDARALVLAGLGALACGATSRMPPQAPTVEGDTIVVQTWSDGSLLRIDARSGRELSRVTSDDLPWADGPVVRDGAAWLVRDGSIRAIDAATGAVRWSRPGSFESVGAVDEHSVYAFDACRAEGCGEPRWIAIDRASRQERWSVRGEARIPPVVGEGVVAAGDGPRLVVRDAATGAVRWTRTFVGDARAVASSGGVVWALDVASSLLVALDAPTGAELRRFTIPGADAVGRRGPWSLLPADAAAGAALLVVSGGEVRAFTPDAATPRWSRPGTGVVVTGSRALITTPEGHLVCLDAATGRTRWVGDASVGWTRGAVAGDHLVLRRGDDWLDVHDLATGRLRFRFALDEGTITPAP